MSRWVRRSKYFLRHMSLYDKATYISACCLVLVFLFGLAFLLPNADSSSTRAGLTIIAEILGVLLGAALVVAGLLIEQSGQAEQLLRTVFPKYRGLIQQRARTVGRARAELCARIGEGKIQLDDPLWVGWTGKPSSTSFRDVVSAASTLVYTLRGLSAVGESGYPEEDLRLLGYSQDEIGKVLYADSQRADTDAESFLRTVLTALDVSCIVPNCSNEAGDFAMQVFADSERDGVGQALRRLDRSRRLLGGKAFAVGVILPTITMASAVLTVFGITNRTLACPVYRWVVVFIVVGFGFSILLTLRLLGRVLD